MPIPAEQRASWLNRLASDPRDTAVALAGVVRADLDAIRPGGHLRVGTRLLDDIAGQSLLLTLLTSNDMVETSDLAKQYIELATIERA